MYKGTKLGTFTPIGQVQLISNVQESHSETDTLLQIDLTTELSQMEQKELLELLNSFSTLFEGDGEPVRRTGVVKHDIKTSGAPIRQTVCRLPQSMKHIVDGKMKKMLQQGIIRPSTSPWSSIVMVRKKDGSWRFCIDYRKINAVTQQDAYPLPRIDATLDSMVGSVYFTTLP